MEKQILYIFKMEKINPNSSRIEERLLLGSEGLKDNLLQHFNVHREPLFAGIKMISNSKSKF